MKKSIVEYNAGLAPLDADIAAQHPLLSTGAHGRADPVVAHVAARCLQTRHWRGYRTSGKTFEQPISIAETN